MREVRGRRRWTFGRGLGAGLAAGMLALPAVSGATSASPAPLTLMRLSWSSAPAGADLIFLHTDRTGVGAGAKVHGRWLRVPLPGAHIGSARLRAGVYVPIRGAWWAAGYELERTSSGLGLHVRLRAPLEVTAVGATGGFAVGVLLGPARSIRKPAGQLFGAVPAAPLALGPEPAAVKESLPVVAIHAAYGVRLRPAHLPAHVTVALARTASGPQAAYALRLYGGKVLYLPFAAGAKARGLVGADGSFEATLSLPDGATLTVSSDSACVGCALGGGAEWFPAVARQERAQMGFGPTGPLPTSYAALIGLRTVRPRLVRYAFTASDGRVVEGFGAAPLSRRALALGAVGLAFFGSFRGPAVDAAQGDIDLSAALGSMGGRWVEGR